MRDYSDEPYTAADFDGPSKTQRKREMHDLQDLGTALLSLPAARRDAIEMDERLREALKLHGRMPTREAKRRHMQYIGKLLRDTDSEPARRALAAFHAGDARVLQETERWRDLLLASDGAMTDWIRTYPDCDVQALRVLIRNTRREMASDQGAGPDPAASMGKGRAFRELFQKLRAVLLQAAETSPDSWQMRMQVHPE
ncbi:MAG: ribosome biogenesis factor YjgA [Panacagrimonas sp.]